MPKLPGFVRDRPGLVTAPPSLPCVGPVERVCTCGPHLRTPSGLPAAGSAAGAGRGPGTAHLPWLRAAPRRSRAWSTNTPRCFHSGGMWQVWARVPQPSRGHER